MMLRVLLMLQTLVGATRTLFEKSGVDAETQARRQRTQSIRSCATVVLCGFVLFLIGGVLAVCFPTLLARNVILAVGTGIILVSLTFSMFSAYRSRRGPDHYDCKLGNTVLCCLLMMILCMIMYPLYWYPSLQNDVLQEEVEDMPILRPPGVAIVQMVGRPDSANLLDYPASKAFVSDLTGGFGDDSEDCRKLSSDQIMYWRYCNCSDMWASQLASPLPTNLQSSTVYRTFAPDHIITFNSTSQTLVLQTYWNYNTSNIPEGWPIPTPTLMLILWDSTRDFSEAFWQDLTTTTMIQALGRTTVTVDLEYRVGWQERPYYFYNARVSTTTFLNLVCDVAKDPGRWCYTTVVIELGSMTRLKSTRKKEANAGDIFAAVGGYFALVQFFSWILSGMALEV